MLDSLKRLTKNSAIYGIGHIFARSIAFFLLPIYTNFLPTEDFGVAVLLLSLLAVCNIFYVYGMDSAFLRYFIEAEQIGEKKSIFSTVFYSILGTALLFSVVGYHFADELAGLIFGTTAHAELLQLCFGILFFDGLSAIPFLALRAEEKSVQFVSLKSLITIATLLLNWIFIIHWQWGLAGIFRANLYASAAGFLLLLPVVFRYLFGRFSLSSFKLLMRFGLPYIPSTLAVILMDVIDRFFLERMAGSSAVGLYGAGYRLGMFMALFIAAFRFAWHPFFLATAKKPDAQAIFSKVLSYFLLSCACVFLAISYFIDDIVRVQIGKYHIFGEAYWQSTTVVPIVMLAYVFYGAYVNFVVGIHIKKKTQYLPLITGAGLIANIVGNLLLIPRWNILGAAWATVISYAIMALALYFVAQRLYPVRYEFGRIAKLVTIVGVFYANFALLQWGFVSKLGFGLLFIGALFASESPLQLCKFCFIAMGIR